MGVSVLSFYYRYRNCFQETLPLLSLKGKSVEIVIFHLWMDKWKLSFSFTNYRMCTLFKVLCQDFHGIQRWARQDSCSKGEFIIQLGGKKYLYAKVNITREHFITRESYEWSKKKYQKEYRRQAKEFPVKVTGDVMLVNTAFEMNRFCAPYSLFGPCISFL